MMARKKTTPASQPGNAKSRGDSPVSYLLDLAKPALVALFSGVGGVLVYVLTPLNEVVNSWIWKEKAELILVVQNRLVHEGDVFGIDVFVLPTSPATVSEGLLTVTHPPAISRPAPDARLVQEVPRLTGSKRITSEALTFLAQTAGRGSVRADFVTKNGLRLSESVIIEVLPASSQSLATLKNFSGTWNVDLGRITGTMTIVDRAKTINGEYHLANGETGQIEGTRDGETFRTTFYRGAKPSRWWISATFNPDPKKDLELKGTAELLLAAPAEATGWKPVARAESFHAVARRP